MAIEGAKNFDVRIILKNDDISAWNGEDSIILEKGEIGLAKVTVNSQDPVSGETVPVPTYLIKVGDGTSKFSELNWLAAPAADVHGWAKAAEKPTYNANEIDGLEAFIAGEIDDSNTTYTFDTATDGTLKITKHEKSEEGPGEEVASISFATPTQLSALSTRVGVLEKAGYWTETAGKAYVNEQIGTVSTSVDSVKTELLGTEEDPSTSNTIYGAKKAAEEANTAASAASTAASEAKTAATKAQTTADAAKKAADDAASAAEAAQATADNAMPKAGGEFNGPVTYGSGANLSTAADATATFGGAATFNGTVNFTKAVTIQEPSENSNPATKKYVDDAVSGATAGLTGAMHFVGVSSTNPALSGATVEEHEEFAVGDVVLYDNKEFVLKAAGNEAENWIELGDEGSYVLKTQTVNGKPLSGNIELTAEDVGAASASDIETAIQALDSSISATAGSALASITVADGKITEKTEIEIPKELKNPNALTVGEKTYDGSLAVEIELSDLGGATAADITTEIGKLDSAVAATAEAADQYSVLTGVTQEDGKLTAKTEVKLAAIAKTGSTDNLEQGTKIIVLNCGGATE